MNTKLKEDVDYFYTQDRPIYGKFVYFFKREILKDHYFENNGKIYLLKHSPDNYNPSITETGKYSDIFKIPIDKCENVTEEFNKKEEDNTPHNNSNLTLAEVINTLEILLTKTKEELEKLKKLK